MGNVRHIARGPHGVYGVGANHLTGSTSSESPSAIHFPVTLCRFGRAWCPGTRRVYGTGDLIPCARVLLSPPVMAGYIVQHLAECRAHAVIAVPAVCSYWFPLVQHASVRSLQVARSGESDVFVWPHHRRPAATHIRQVGDEGV